MRNLFKCLITGLVWLAAVLALIVLLGLGTRAVLQHRNAEALAIRSPNGVDEGVYARIGGIDQWLRIRGQDRRNPVLLILHGGPGSPLYPVAYRTLAPLERDFTVVYWDQRGAGRTFGRNGPVKAAAPTSLEQMESDTIEVAEFLRRRLGKTRIGLLAASAGSPFGLMTARDRPDLLYAYIGAGQWLGAEGEKRSYQFALDAARAAKNTEAVQALEQIGPPPYRDHDAARTQRKWLALYQPEVERQFNSQLGLLGLVLTAPGYRFEDVGDMIGGSEFTARNLIPAYDRFDPTTFGKRFAVPMFFFQGTQDHLTPTSLVAEYVATLEAPQKALVLFPGGGHSAFMTDPDRFVREMRLRVHPLGVAAQIAGG